MPLPAEAPSHRSEEMLPLKSERDRRGNGVDPRRALLGGDLSSRRSRPRHRPLALAESGAPLLHSPDRQQEPDRVRSEARRPSSCLAHALSFGERRYVEKDVQVLVARG